MKSYILILFPDTLKRGNVGSVVKVLEDIGLKCVGPVWMPLTEENIQDFSVLTDYPEVWKHRYSKEEYAEKNREFLMCADRGNMLMLRFFNEEIQISVYELVKKMRELYKKYKVPKGSALVVEDRETDGTYFRIIYDSPLPYRQD